MWRYRDEFSAEPKGAGSSRWMAMPPFGFYVTEVTFAGQAGCAFTISPWGVSLLNRELPINTAKVS